MKSLEDDRTVYSNGADAICFWTGRHVSSIPPKVAPDSHFLNPEFEREMYALREDVIQNGAVIVYFNTITWRWYLPSREELEDVSQIPLLLGLEDGVVYGRRDVSD